MNIIARIGDMAIALGIGAIIGLVVTAIFHLVVKKSHAWKYRNPYDRTCELCGRRENLYGDALGPDKREEVYTLAHSPDKCK